MEDVAIVILACRDYEALELALACHAAYKATSVPIYILQNCRGTYDAERTLSVARRYANLFPDVFRVVEGIAPGRPYTTIRSLLESGELSRYSYICKVDEDVFPLHEGWLEALSECYRAASNSNGSLAYVSPLINNHLYGFSLTLDALGIREEYYQEADIKFREESVRSELVGDLIHRHAHVARWLHERTTLQPDRFIAATKGLTPVDISGRWRYSIGCMLFKKSFWQEFDSGIADDEQMLHEYCHRTGARIICARSVPFVHLNFYTQRNELRDIPEKARAVYEPRLCQPFPIAAHSSRLIEIEARLRWLEEKEINSPSPSIGPRQRRSLTTKILQLLKRQ